MDETSYRSNHSLFRHPLVAELAWIIGAWPTMTDHGHKGLWRTLDNPWYEEQFRVHFNWLLSLQEDPSSLVSFLGDERLLLGKRFEKLILFWLNESPLFDVVLHSKQLLKGNKTIGEVDFLVKDILNDRHLHIEVACKYYLGYNNSPSWEKWIGPNARDTLKLKMDKLEQQLSIFHRPEGKALLEELRVSQPEPVLLMKGYFFHHYSVLASHKNPKYANPKYPVGWYTHYHELGKFPGDKGDWIILQKSSWLSPVHRLKDYELLPGLALQTQLKALFNSGRKSLMVARVYQQDDLLIEIDRGIVVCDKWPAQ